VNMEQTVTSTPCRPPPPPRKKGPFVPRERPRAATGKPVPYVGPDDRLFVEYISGVMSGPVIGLAGQNVEASEATALVATDGLSMVRVAQEKVREFLRLHVNHLLVPSDPEWFMTVLGFPADAWERAPDSDTPAPSVQIDLPRPRRPGNSGVAAGGKQAVHPALCGANER